MDQFSFIAILVLIALQSVVAVPLVARQSGQSSQFFDSSAFESSIQPGMKAPDSSDTSMPGPMNPWGTTGNWEGTRVRNPYSNDNGVQPGDDPDGDLPGTVEDPNEGPRNPAQPFPENHYGTAGDYPGTTVRYPTGPNGVMPGQGGMGN
ncbi:hypothetical protein PCANC_22444 [Puccinia coronata f. sp. avenae]|uniref:Uncharacterized protein n=1 Tax=Puccinia coronata f. sp. avenae TaxID=200324 RepID=A0A2N5U4B6_9BASI|nr:hypothetical protein PCANC_22444 [Puccinia coronata f. sp. avenae]